MADDVVLSEAEIQEALASLEGWKSEDNWLQRSADLPLRGFA